MSICIDLSAAAHERAGLGRYAAGLAQALLGLGAPLTAFVNDPRESKLRPPLDGLPRRTVGLPRKLWRLRAALSYFGGPSLDSAFRGVRLYHATEHLLPALKAARAVFTLHDAAYLLFPEHHLPQNRLYLRWMMPRFLARADAVICVSESTRRDALRFYRLNPDKITVIPEGVDPRFRPIEDPAHLSAIRRRYRLPARFILCVSTLEPRKNLTLLLEAYAALRARRPEIGLAIAGEKGWLFEGFFERLKRLGLEGQVRLLGYAPDEDLPALLNCAEVFAYPSLFEGFGLPPLEAMACGAPTLCSNTSSLPEVVGDGGLLLPPDDAQAWVEALEAALSGPEFRADLRARGLRQAAPFTWERAAQATYEVYRRVLA